LGVDGIHASCAIKAAPAAVTWCTSLFLYWDPANWCQIGIIDRNGGHYYVLEMVNRIPREYDLGGCIYDQWHYVGLEVGEDCVRYLSSDDGKEFKAQRVGRRPAEYAGAPK